MCQQQKISCMINVLEVGQKVQKISQYFHFLFGRTISALHADANIGESDSNRQMHLM